MIAIVAYFCGNASIYGSKCAIYGIESDSMVAATDGHTPRASVGKPVPRKRAETESSEVAVCPEPLYA